MSKNLIDKLNYKYNFVTFFNSKSLQIGSLVHINIIKSSYKSNFFGILIKRKSLNNNNWTITLRNVMKKYAVEKNFNLNSKLISNIFLIRNRLRKFNSRYNLFYLRTMGKINSTIKL